MILSIVTCGPQLETALKGPRMKAPSVVRLGGVTPRSTLLLAAVDLLIRDSGLERSALSTVVVGRGPGSFTGIRAGLATAAGLAAAIDCTVAAYDSLRMQAARLDGGTGLVWSAQPGRRGEVYARPFLVGTDGIPAPEGPIEILPISLAGTRGPWIAAESLDLGGGERVASSKSAAEALIDLFERGLETESLEPLYVEGPPVDGSVRGDGPVC